MITEGYSVKAGIATALGHRENNQDFVTYFEPADPTELLESGCIYIVADGVGGAIKGEQASQFASRSVLYEYYQRKDIPIPERLRQAIRNVGNEIFQYARLNNGGAKMATTMVVAVVYGKELFVANVGDSRAYLIRNDTVKQITTDHKVGRNRLTRSVGGEANVQVDLFNVTLQPGDRVMLCSDGFHRYYDGEVILDFLDQAEPQSCAEFMVHAADKAGGADNISVILIEVGDIVPLERVPQTRYLREAHEFVDGRETISDPELYLQEESAPKSFNLGRYKDPRYLIAFLVFFVVMLCTVGGLALISGGVFGDANKKATEHALKATQINSAVQAAMLAGEAATNTSLLNPTLTLSTQPPIPGSVPSAAAVPPATQPLPSPTPLDEIAEYLKNGYCGVTITLKANQDIKKIIEDYSKSQWKGVGVTAQIDKLVLLHPVTYQPRDEEGPYELLCGDNQKYRVMVAECTQKLDAGGEYLIAILTPNAEKCINIGGHWVPPYVPTGTQN
jgi:protein phosphatase